MLRLLTFLIPTCYFCLNLSGITSQLVVVSQGDGAVSKNASQSFSPVEDASFLPQGEMISVRPRSGMETIASGFKIRYGAESRFSLDQNSINLEEGSIMVESRKLEGLIEIKGPEASLLVGGAGCLMGEVETNGGIKIVGIFGRIKISCTQSDASDDLMPGELYFLMPGGKGFSEKVNINLGKLIESSYLLSGFRNSEFFKNSLLTTATAQKKAIGKIYGAEVGDSIDSTSFQLLETNNQPKTEQSAEGLDSKNVSKDLQPLEELLGREPIRGKEAKTAEKIAPANPQPARPFPSRLLRSE